MTIKYAKPNSICPECQSPITKKNRKFCSKQCSCIFNSRLGVAAIQAKGLSRIVSIICKGCSTSFKVPHKERARQFCSLQCKYDCKELNQQTSRQMTENNPMKREDVAQKQSESRIKMFQEHPEMRETISRASIENWANGKYDGAATGKCKWYPHTKPDGTVIKLQGTWEVAFARRLDEMGVAYQTHKGWIKYADGAGTQRHYLPDFYLPLIDVYVDVKGAFWNETQEEKIGWITDSNPDMHLVIATRDVLEELGVRLNEVQRELLGVVK